MAVLSDDGCMKQSSGTTDTSRIYAKKSSGTLRGCTASRSYEQDCFSNAATEMQRSRSGKLQLPPPPPPLHDRHKCCLHLFPTLPQAAYLVEAALLSCSAEVATSPITAQTASSHLTERQPETRL